MCLVSLVPYEEQLIPWEMELEELYAQEEWWEDCMGEEWSDSFPVSYANYLEEWGEDKEWIQY